MKANKYSLIVGMALLFLIVIETGCDDVQPSGYERSVSKLEISKLERRCSELERRCNELEEGNKWLRLILYISIPSTNLVALFVGAWVGLKGRKGVRNPVH